MAKSKKRKKPHNPYDNVKTTRTINEQLAIEPYSFFNSLVPNIFVSEECFAANLRDASRISRDYHDSIAPHVAATIANNKRLCPMVLAAGEQLCRSGQFPTFEDAMSRDQIIITEDSMRLMLNMRRLEIFEQYFDNTPPSQQILDIIPCYSHGTLIQPHPRWDHETSGELRDAFLWDVLDINLNEPSLTLTIQFAHILDDKWVPISRAREITIKPGVEDTIVQSLRLAAALGVMTEDSAPKHKSAWLIQGEPELPSQLYKIPSRAISVSTDDRQFYDARLIRMLRREETAKDAVRPAMQMPYAFVTYMWMINRLLRQNAISRPATKAHRKVRAEIDHAAMQEAPVEERRTRICAGISFSSKRPPKAPTEETVIKYKTAAWKVRGFVRHYKSGKTSYIKPGVRRRKALIGKTDSEAVARSVLEISAPPINNKEAQS